MTRNRKTDVRFKRRRGAEIPLALVCLGIAIAFPSSTIKTAGKLQEPNDAAAYNAKGLQLSRSRKFEEAGREKWSALTRAGYVGN